jgi:chorismate dehydratase
VILRKFYGKHCSLRIAPFPQEQHDHPFLLIGDDAMRHNWQLKISEKQRASHFTYVYDLGEIWHNKTGLPFVFALWMVRREVFDDNVQRELLRHFTRYLDQSKEIIPNNLAEIAGHVPLSFSLPQNEIVAYWDNLDYELTDAHKRGLSLFEQYLRELDCL